MAQILLVGLQPGRDKESMDHGNLNLCPGKGIFKSRLRCEGGK